MNEIIKKLRKELKLTQQKVAKSVGVSKATISQWEKGDTSPNGKNLIALMRVLNTSYEELNPSLKDGRNKRTNNKSDINALVMPDIGDAVPLISWVGAGDFCDNVETFVLGGAENYYPCPAKHSKSTFALKVQGLSMHPEFSPNEIIYVDPEVEALNGAFVVVIQNNDNEATFKQFKIIGGSKLLQTVNQNMPVLIEMKPDTKICGVVIGSYKER